MDGYRIAEGSRPRASLKGVIADEVRFERGFTRADHVDAGALRAAARSPRRACAGHQPLLGRARQRILWAAELPAMVPELIDLAEWRRLLD